MRETKPSITQHMTKAQAILRHHPEALTFFDIQADHAGVPVAKVQKACLLKIAAWLTAKGYVDREFAEAMEVPDAL
jgi:hypothetical protein